MAVMAVMVLAVPAIIKTMWAMVVQVVMVPAIQELMVSEQAPMSIIHVVM